MTIDQNALAPALGVAGKNVPQTVEATVLKRKILLIGTYDPALTSVVDEVPVRILSAEDAGAKFGFGFMLHRMAVQAFKSAPSVEIYAQPQDEDAGVQADGTLLFDTAPGINGTLYLYIVGILVEVAMLAADTTDDLATNTVAAITANKNLPITAVVNGAVTDQVDITAKSEGDYWGNAITIDINLYGEADAGALAYTITPMASGAGTPDITDALDALGTGSAQNSDNYTDVVHAYGPVTAVLDKIQTYNGAADQEVGNFDDLVHKPFRSVNGDTAAGSGGLSTLIALGNGRKADDRTSGVIPVPGSASHPVEIACLAMGYMATQNNSQAELSYKSIVLDGIHPGAVADRWTNDYTSGRNAAALAGISCTFVSAGSVLMQNALTFYHPDSVPVNSNAYRNMRNISLIQNIFAAVALQFGLPKWQNFSIVTDLAFVTNVASRATARSTSSVKDDWIALFTAFAGNAWIADRQFSVDALKASDAVVVRGSGNGFNAFPKFIFSGDGDILDNTIEYDTSFAILQ